MSKNEEVELQAKDLEKPKDSEDTYSSLQDFDDILDVVGGNGRYQKRLLFGILAPICLVAPFFDMNRLFMLSQPDHWCHVPGRPSDMELSVWKNITLPMEEGSDGQSRFSKCEMYGLNGTKVKCEQWEYDTSDYDSTIPSEFNWVCDNEHYVANVWSVSGLGWTIGSVFLGIAVDKFGRKSTYFSTILCFIVFSLASLFIPGNYSAFLVLQFFWGISTSLLIASPAMITTEMVGKESRAWVYSVSVIAFVIGNCLLPLFAFWLRSWFSIGLMTPVSAALIFVYYKSLPESPRWLLSAGRQEEAAAIVVEIGRVNGSPVKPEEIAKAMKFIRGKEEDSGEKTHFWTLFSNRILAIRTILIGIALSANGIVYGGLVLNITSMAGNEFLNYFLLGIIELPVGWIAGYVSNKFGRRWTRTVLFGLTGVVFAVAAVAVFDSSSSRWILITAAVIGNFFLSINSVIVSLHATELFPTPLRSTGFSFAGTISSVLGLGTPYIVLLGKNYAAAPYIIFMAVSLIGTITAPFLPETANRKLPETVEDANSFAKGHKFWSFLPKD